MIPEIAAIVARRELTKGPILEHAEWHERRINGVIQLGKFGVRVTVGDFAIDLRGGAIYCEEQSYTKIKAGYN